MGVKLFSSRCPMCLILEKKLKDKNIEFEIINDFKELPDLGFRSLPILRFGDKYMDFSDSMKFLSEMV
jgi:hypothetical protein